MNESLLYRFISIKTNQFALLDESSCICDGTIQIQNGYSYSIDTETGIFTCIFTCIYGHEEKMLMKIETQASYLLNEACMKQFVKDGKFTMPAKTVAHFTSMLYGATRGIMVCKLEGSPLANVILPPIDMNVVIDKPLIMSIG